MYGGEEELVINGYSDAAFQTDQDDSRSQSGFVFCLNGGAVSWKSSKQDTVADSTTESDYIAVGFSLCLNMSNTFNIAAELQQAQDHIHYV